MRLASALRVASVLTVLVLLASEGRAAPIVYDYSGVLQTTLGSSPAGTPFSGRFVYEAPQAGTVTPFFGGTQSVFAFTSLTLTIGGQTVTAGTGSLGLYNNVNPPNGVPVGDSFYTFVPGAGGSPLPSTGSLPGVTPNFIYLGFVDRTGQVFGGPGLPTSLTLSTFSEAFVGVNFGPPGAGNTTEIHRITSLTGGLAPAVPEPGSLALLGIGLLGVSLRALAKRRAA